jgi:hypothetical protein
VLSEEGVGNRLLLSLNEQRCEQDENHEGLFHTRLLAFDFAARQSPSFEKIIRRSAWRELYTEIPDLDNQDIQNRIMREREPEKRDALPTDGSALGLDLEDHTAAVFAAGAAGIPAAGSDAA